MLAQIPCSSFRSCQASTVDARLLARADTDGLAVIGEADRVRLGIFERNHSDDQIAFGLRRQFSFRGWDIFEQAGIGNERIALLFKRDAKNVAALNLGWLVVRVYLQDEILP